MNNEIVNDSNDVIGNTTLQNVETKFCTTCGNKLVVTAFDCEKCGNKFPFYQTLTKEEKNERRLQSKAVLLYFVGYSLIGVFILAIIATVISLIVFNSFDLLEMIEYIYKGQIVLDIIFLGLFIFIFRKMFSLDKFKERNILKMIGITLGAFAVVLIVNLSLGNLIGWLFNVENSTNEEALDALTSIAPATLIFAAVIFAPIVEEIVFRGAIFNLLYKKNNPVFAILVSGAIFASLHVVGGLALGNFVELAYFFLYFALGAIFGLLYYKTKNIYICIAVHFLNNFISVLLMFLL